MPVRRGPLFLSAALSLALAKSASADEPTKQEMRRVQTRALKICSERASSRMRARNSRCAPQKACPAVVREDCAERLRALDQVLPSVVFTLVVSPKNASESST